MSEQPLVSRVSAVRTRTAKCLHFGLALVLQGSLIFITATLVAAPAPAPLPEATRTRLLGEAEALGRAVNDWPGRTKSPDLAADIAVFGRAVAWALHYDQDFSEANSALLPRLIERGQRRLESLRSNAVGWTARKGRVARAFFSTIDGSAQPYGMVIPARYDGKRPMRLDVVLHGSKRPDGVVEAAFLGQFDDSAEAIPPEADYLELHPLGRVENCYRWAGETDVFEAIEAACRNYNIDRDRIVLRGMSMGASGAWHLGLKHPDRFAALGPYCGYVDTHQFSLTPLPNFPKVGPLPRHQEKGLHIYDAKDWAVNAGMVPVVAAMGEKDIFFDAHVIMARAMKREGLELVNLISPGTGHTLDPATHREQMKRIADHLDRRSERAPQRVHFATWTLRYNRCHWLEVLGLREHYQRADIDGIMEDDGGIDLHEPINITRFAILTDRLPRPVRRIRIHGHRVAAPDPILQKRIVVAFEEGAWQLIDEKEAKPTQRKSPGLQGPIDDAFTGSFLCVRGTGAAWNESAKSWADRALDRFAADWRRYFRGDCPVKNDRDVTADDVQTKHLILFGDPGSNPWIARVLPKLPIGWTKTTVTVGEQSHPAASYVPALIHPNPLASGRYVVLNSGHTFRGKDINYLMFPRWGDWTVIHFGGKPAVDVLAEEVVRSGFFDEDWQIVPDGDSH